MYIHTNMLIICYVVFIISLSGFIFLYSKLWALDKHVKELDFVLDCVSKAIELSLVELEKLKTLAEEMKKWDGK